LAFFIFGESSENEIKNSKRKIKNYNSKFKIALLQFRINFEP